MKWIYVVCHFGVEISTLSTQRIYDAGGQPFIRYASIPVMFFTVKHPSKPPSLNDSGLRSIQKFIRVSSWNENIVDTGLGWLTPNLGDPWEN